MVLSDKSTMEEPFAKEYYLHFYPFILKGIQNNIPPTLRDKIVDLDIYKTLNLRAKGEERRLLYVGMTRAKDYLYSFGYKGNTPGSKMQVFRMSILITFGEKNSSNRCVKKLRSLKMKMPRRIPECMR